MNKRDIEFEASPATVDGFNRLMAAILLQAAIDARTKQDPALKVEATLWLASDEAGAICDALQVGDVFAALMSGNNAPRIKHGWREGRTKNSKIGGNDG